MGKTVNKNISVGWVLIPPPILSSTEITPNEKLLFGKIFGLITNTGECYASNDWIGNELGLDKSTVSKLISSLVEKDFFYREIIANEKGEVVKRILTVNFKKININMSSDIDPYTPTGGGVYSKEDIPILQPVVPLINIKKKIRERDSLKVFNHMSYLKNVPLEDIKEFMEEFDATEKQIRLKGEELTDWCLANGRRKKDYKATLRNALRKDYPKKDLTQNFNNGGFIDYDEAKHKGLI